MRAPFHRASARQSLASLVLYCTVEGNAQPAAFTVSGDTLTFTDDAGARDVLCCK
jgi:hypothetical protein